MPREGSHRYNLVLPVSMFNEIEEMARDRGLTVAEFIKRSIKLTMLFEETRAKDAEWILRMNGQDTLVKFIL